MGRCEIECAKACEWAARVESPEMHIDVNDPGGGNVIPEVYNRYCARLEKVALKNGCEDIMQVRDRIAEVKAEAVTIAAEQQMSNLGI